MVKRIFYVVCLFLVQSFVGFAQKDSILSIINLSTVEIVTPRLLNFSSGSKFLKLDSSALSEHQHQNLGELLSSESPIFIKSYGLGSLATSSFRGASAGQTAVLWNGFNLNSSMNGVLDFSLIPSGFLDEVNVQFGGSGALWGSSAVGGAIHLNNLAQFNQGTNIKIGSSVGSFGSNNQHTSIKISKKKWLGSVKMFKQTAQNNFDFLHPYLPDSPMVKQKHAKFLSQGLLIENHFLLPKNQGLNVLIWYQNTDREIPPTFFQNTSSAKQNDKALRVSSQWNLKGKIKGKKLELFARAAYFNESIYYEDSVSAIFSNNRSQNLIAESEVKIQLAKQHQINIGLNNTFLVANVNAYAALAQQNRASLFSSYAYFSKSNKVKISASLRQELVDSKWIPTTYSAGFEWQFMSKISLLSNASKVYRLPTFNDKYWNPGGNPNLLPESGFSEEVGLKFNSDFLRQKATILSEITLFNRNMDNWIVWLPSSGFWTPQNVLEVWSRGLESRTRLCFKLGKLKSTFSFTSNYVVSSNEKAISENDASVGKQLIYVPMYSGQGKINLQYQKFSLSYNHSYTGFRYTSSDNTEYLSPYFLGTIYASFAKSFKKINADIFIQINNVWGTNYQLMEARPMPLTNFNLGINLTFINSKTNQP